MLRNSVIIFRDKIVGAKPIRYQADACPSCMVIRKCIKDSSNNHGHPLGCHDILHRYIYSKSNFVIPSGVNVKISEILLTEYSLFMISIKRKLLNKKIK